MHERVATGRALGILVTLGHFRHLFILQYQLFIARGGSKNKFNKVELDATQIKWANGVHLFAPFNWQLTNFNLFWPESLPIYFLTVFGLIYFALNWRESPSPQDLLIPRSTLRVWTLIFSVIAYFVLPFFFSIGLKVLITIM